MSYSRLGYLALKLEATENTAVKPNKFIPFLSEDIVAEWGVTPATPIAANRTRNIRKVITAIPAPAGTINLQVEPKTIGWFLKGLSGALITGLYLPISSVVGTFVVGETITGGTSAATGVIVAISSELDYLLVTISSGTFTAAGEAITGGSSSATANIGVNAATVYGHQTLAPQTSLPTYTVEIGFQNEAYRYTGVRFNGIDPFAQADNIITAAVNMTARSVFHHARVTAAVNSGSGSKTIPLDQTTGLLATDTVKVFRPSTGAFLDFSASSVKTHTVGTVPGETSITVTDLQTSLAVGDLLMLAPQTPSYTVDNEFSWIGGSTVKMASTMVLALAATADSIEDFEVSLVNELEAKHGANGTNVVNRFPTKNFLKGLTGTGKFTRTYTDMAYLDKLRNNNANSVQVKHIGSQIGSTGVYYTLDLRIPSAVFSAFNPNMGDDALLNQEMNFDMYDNTTSGFLMKALLINDVTAYT